MVSPFFSFPLLRADWIDVGVQYSLTRNKILKKWELSCEQEIIEQVNIFFRSLKNKNKISYLNRKIL